MKVFVTGATGFIGQHLCKRLIDERYEVLALVRSVRKSKVLPKSVESLVGDLSIFKDPDFELPQCDIVIHLAGIITAKNEAEYSIINYECVVSLVNYLEAQKWKPKHFLFASSLAAAGPTKYNQPVNESTKPNPVEEYGQAKLEAENYLSNASFPTTSFRPGIVLGPLDTATLTLYKMAKRGLGFRMSGPAQQVSWVDIDDLVDAILRMSSHSDNKHLHNTYFVSHTDNTDSISLFKEIGKAQKKQVLLVPIPRWFLKMISVVMILLNKVIPFKNQIDRKQYQQLTAEAFICTSDKLRNEMNWTPKRSLQESIQNSVQGYRKAGWI